MKTLRHYLTIVIVAMSATVFAQQPNLQFFRPVGQSGLNVFETSKTDTVTFDGLKVRTGGDFAMQFQALSHSNATDNLVKLGSNFNLPTANLNFDVQVADGMRMHLRTYLSSKHHNESWVKGGHLQIDKLNFIKEGFLDGIMQYTTFTIGLDEFNYGDAHYRRSDNARAMYNPFVGNYIMDAFSTEAFGDVTIQKSGLLLVLGATNGKLNQNVVRQQAVNAIPADNKVSFFGKVGYDNQLNDDLRVRLTGSWYINNGINTGTWLYGGDRAGSRYYNIMRTIADPTAVPPVANASTDFDGRFNARFAKITAIQINPFVKFKGLELFGIYEIANGNNDIAAAGATPATTEGGFTQIAAEMVYRFGTDERFYVAGRYNTIDGKTREDQTENLNISRINVGGGWFLTKNVMTKIEYVKQNYNGDAWTGGNARFLDGEFKGIVFEAVISF